MSIYLQVQFPNSVFTHSAPPFTPITQHRLTEFTFPPPSHPPPDPPPTGRVYLLPTNEHSVRHIIDFVRMDYPINGD